MSIEDRNIWKVFKTGDLTSLTMSQLSIMQSDTYRVIAYLDAREIEREDGGLEKVAEILRLALDFRQSQVRRDWL